MIHARSPYYAQSRTLLSNEVAIRLELYIWTGDATADKPASPNYRFNIQRPSTTITVLTKDISPMVRDFFISENVSLFTNLQTTQNQTVWAQWDIIVVDDTGTDVDTTSSVVEDAVMGYTDFMDNINFDDTFDGEILMSSGCQNIWNKGIVIVPIKATGITGVDLTINRITTNFPITPSDLSAEQIYYFNFSVEPQQPDDGIITFETKNGATVIDTKNINVICESKFSPLNIVFKNKYGVYENMYLFRKPQEAIQTTSEKFKSGISQGQTYNTSVGQYRKYNVNAKETIKGMTGYVKECFNETIKQVVISEKVFLQTQSELIPINVKSENVQFLSQLVDQKINYELEFEYAFDTINTM